MPFEHSRKQQNVGYTDDTIGCSLKQPKMTAQTVELCTTNMMQRYLSLYISSFAHKLRGIFFRESYIPQKQEIE